MEYRRKHVPTVRRPSIAGDDPAANNLGLRKETALTKLQSLVEQAADTVIRRQPLPAGIQVAANKAIGN
jgi:hypothetical protein